MRQCRREARRSSDAQLRYAVRREAFGTKRAMFESNYPVDRWGATYPVLWNAFKRITAEASETEKAALYSGNAARFYDVEYLLPVS